MNSGSVAVDVGTDASCPGSVWLLSAWPAVTRLARLTTGRAHVTLCHGESRPAWLMASAKAATAAKVGNAMSGLFRWQTSPVFDLDRQHKPRSDRVGRPGLESGTYGLKALSSDFWSCYLRCC